MLEVRTAVKNLHAYYPPLEGRVGMRLDFNENTVGCSPRVLTKLRSIDRELLARYPERRPVEIAVAKALGIDDEQVLLTNGVDEGIHLLCSTYLDPGDEALIVVPTFAMYAVSARAEGASVVEVLAGKDFAFPLNSLLSKIGPHTRLIAIANPNNPTGAATPVNVLLRIAEAAPHAAILVDEAYFEFHGETILTHVGRVPNLFVARTFSKAYGLAGLRIGILVGAASQMAIVRRITSPYNVNSVALAVLPEALEDRVYMEGYAAEVRRNRDTLQHELGNLNLQYWPSRANFVLVRIGNKRAEFLRMLRERGVLVRDRHTDPGCDGCVRLTVGSHAQTQVLIAAMREVVEKLCLGSEVRA
jgi:histidinol-phosphate aminotransferase